MYSYTIYLIIIIIISVNYNKTYVFNSVLILLNITVFVLAQGFTIICKFGLKSKSFVLYKNIIAGWLPKII